MSFSYKEKVSGFAWYEAAEVVSTNDAVKELIKENEKVVLSAIEQTGGRGRRGRKWLSIKGNLYFTLSLEIKPQELSRYICMIGLSVAKTVKKFSETADIKIKWPNDVFLNNKKLTGILLENIKDNLYAVGIGVNIVGSPKIEDMPYQATSLKEAGISVERTTFLKEYLQTLSDIIEEYQKKGFDIIREKWLALAYNLGKEVTIHNESRQKKGIFLTLDENGYLILKTDKGKERIIAGDLFV